MFIRTQKAKEITQGLIDSQRRAFYVEGNGSEWSIVVQDTCVSKEEDILCIADYSTKERAMEVLGEIASAIEQGYPVYRLPEE